MMFDSTDCTASTHTRGTADNGDTVAHCMAIVAYEIGKDYAPPLLDPPDYRELRSEARIREQHRLHAGLAHGKNARIAHIKKMGNKRQMPRWKS